MTTIQTLTPNANGAVVAPWTLTGAATAHAALADASDASYVWHQWSDDNGNLPNIDFTTYALAATERCRAIRVTGRGGSDFGIFMNVFTGADGIDTYVRLDSGYNNPQNEVGAWDDGVFNAPGGEWDQAEIDALRVTLSASNAVGGFNGSKVMKLSLELDVMTKPPAPTINNPTLDQVVPLSPTFTWTYVGGGDVQKKYRIKVFTDAVVTGGGFNPDTSVAVFDATESGSGTSATPSALVLTPGVTYHVYMKVAKDFNGQDWWSDWSAGRRFKANNRPTAAVTAPVGAVTLTNKPNVTWNYADTDGDPQTHYQVKVFEQPGGTWVGFDPDVAVPYWETGWVVSAGTSVQVQTALINSKTYRAYVKVKQSSPSVIESLWAFSDFTTNFATAAVPIIDTVVFEDRVDVMVWRGPSALLVPGTVGNYASTPDHVSLDILGDIEIEADVLLTDWTPAVGNMIISKQGVPGISTAGWAFRVGTTGQLSFTWGDGAAKTVTSTVAVPAANGVRIKVKMTLDVNDGAGNRVAKFYTSTNGGVTWTQLGATVTTAGITSITANSTVVELGGAASGTSFNLNGQIFEVKVRDGIGGPLVASPAPMHLKPGTTSWTDDQGRVWTVFGTSSIATVAESAPNADWIDVERSLDGGLTWAPFRYGSLALSTDFSPAAPFTITDYEVPLREEIQYRAISVTTDSGEEVASVPSALELATPTGVKVWLKDPSDGALGRHFMVTDKWLTKTRKRSRTVHQALGRQKPLVVRGSGQGLSFGITFLILGQADADALEELILADRTLFVQTPKGNWYAEVASDVEEAAHLWDDLHNEEDVWTVTIPFVEVDL